MLIKWISALGAVALFCESDIDHADLRAPLLKTTSTKLVWFTLIL